MYYCWVGQSDFDKKEDDVGFIILKIEKIIRRGNASSYIEVHPDKIFVSENMKNLNWTETWVPTYTIFESLEDAMHNVFKKVFNRSD